MAQPVCRHLRTKKYYIPNREAPASFMAEEHPGAQYWCLRTMTVVGPDNTPVGPADCKRRRACFDTVDIVFA